MTVVGIMIHHRYGPLVTSEADAAAFHMPVLYCCAAINTCSLVFRALPVIIIDAFRACLLLLKLYRCNCTE